jgi:hypothetical protein
MHERRERRERENDQAALRNFKVSSIREPDWSIWISCDGAHRRIWPGHSWNSQLLLQPRFLPPKKLGEEMAAMAEEAQRDDAIILDLACRI